ncbi:hypothetical protein EVAR_4985_1 [Eumeta japonica]|uniref:Uncharacterized protein n=1 Tax=Eumeta variegata TaxID=151549 RepID=A0A4C1V0F7_EUMVA|nr:hypothetical protein EVAR_4985_1 [Eumeta japonica]
MTQCGFIRFRAGGGALCRLGPGARGQRAAGHLTLISLALTSIRVFLGGNKKNKSRKHYTVQRLNKPLDGFAHDVVNESLKLHVAYCLTKSHFLGSTRYQITAAVRYLR